MQTAYLTAQAEYETLNEDAEKKEPTTKPYVSHMKTNRKFTKKPQLRIERFKQPITKRKKRIIPN